MRFSVSNYQNHLKNHSFGSNIIYINKVKSTNDEIWKYIDSNSPAIMVADEQISGRGRRDNTWFSQNYKSLTASIGIIENKNNPLLGQRVSLAISSAIFKVTGLPADVKWPNDILIKNKKVAGILIESKYNKNNRILNIGIGINVNIDTCDFPENLKNTITSLSAEKMNIISREELLANIINAFGYYIKLNDETIIEEWQNKCCHNNLYITFHCNNKIIKGVFVGLDESGSAMIKSNDKLEY